MAWTNKDGLYIKYGREEGETGLVGEYRYHGPEAVSEFVLDLTTLTSADKILDYNYIIPEDVRITKVDVVVEVPPVSSGGANLNLGLFKAGTHVVFDADGLIAAGDDFIGGAVGKIFPYTQGSTEAGAQIGVATVEPYLLSANVDTSTFSAGVVSVRVYYYQAPGD